MHKGVRQGPICWVRIVKAQPNVFGNARPGREGPLEAEAGDEWNKLRGFRLRPGDVFFYGKIRNQGKHFPFLGGSLASGVR